MKKNKRNKMDVIFISRGRNTEVKRMIMWLETWMHPFPIIDEKGKKMMLSNQGGLKPIQLWSYTYPKEEKELVLSTMGFAGEGSNIGWLQGLSQMGILRKALKLKPIPEFKKVDTKYIAKEFVQLMPIGIKEDLENKEFKEVDYH